MIIWAALEAIRQKYHDVGQLHPLYDYVLGVPALLANGHTRDTVYVRRYVQAQYDEKWHDKMIGTILPPNSEQNIIHSSGR
jgi:hypothetical protein